MPASFVNTTCGPVEGFVTSNGVQAYLGVPYAAPPVGPRRWRKPEAPQPWTSVRSANRFGCACHQWSDAYPGGRHPVQVIADHVLVVPEPRSEDCLFLNVWTPASDKAQRPVMVWIHGGGLENGSGGQPNYDGSHLAANEDVVVVTFNMRLGPFGYLRLVDVTGGRIPSTGNEGRWDEIAALIWVRENIAQFGGDPGNVTIFGQSAGSVEVAALLAAPDAEGLFQRAILHSSAAHSAQSVEHANDIAALFLEVAGVDPDDHEAIAALSAEQLTAASVALLGAMAARDPKLGKMHFNPVIDGDLISARPVDAVAQGASYNVDVMVGTTLDETRIGLGTDAPSVLDAASVDAQLRVWLGDETANTIDAYRGFLSARGAPGDPIDVLLAIETDRVLRQPAIQLSEVLERRGTAGHHFLVTYPSLAYSGKLGACHAVELPLLFGTFTDARIAPFCGNDTEAVAFSRKIQRAWVGFARNGDPGIDLDWPKYGKARETMVMGYEWSIQNAPFDAERRHWHSLAGDTGLGIM